MATRGEGTKGGKTLFITNLPYTVNNKQLEDVFTHYGTLRKCFVVKNKGEKGDQCRGFGYVSYSTREEATRAKGHVKVIANRPVRIMYARGKNEEPSEEERKGGAYDIGRTVIITSLSEDTTNKQLRVRCRKIGPIETLEYPVPGKDKTTASVTFKTHKDARQALNKLQLKMLNGQFMQVSLLSKDIKGLNRKSLKKSRLIVRNISFKCTEDELMELFNDHGSVISAQIVKNENNRSLGYGFVQFGSYIEAHRAMKAVNGVTFKDRPIAVDWVIPREKYQESKKSTEINNTSVNDTISTNDISVAGSDHVSSVVSDTEEVMASGDENEQCDDNDTLVTQEEEEEEEEESISQAPPSDVQEGKTLFIRNVPFDVDRSELFQVFQQFGGLKYCRPVLDPVTNKCKGSAFVQYRSVGSVNACIEESKSEQGIWIGQDRLMVDIAVSKEELAHMKKAAKQQELTQKDSRNLYLLEEGYIDPLSVVGQEMSKLDANKRYRSLQERRTKLKNPHYFISKTRLSVRNLPVSVNEKTLKTLMMEHAGKHAIIKQVKLIRSKEQFLPDGLGRPVGYGFVEFKDHNCALTALRSLNNNPSVFGEDKRPIVEFALEDSRALKLMSKRKIQQARSLKRGEEKGGHTNKRVEWQLKWKERRLKKRSNPKPPIETSSSSSNSKTTSSRKPGSSNIKTSSTIVKGKAKVRSQTAAQRQKIKRISVHDKKRGTVKVPTVSFGSKVSNYKNKLFNNFK